jgi:hypothetical protein
MERTIDSPEVRCRNEIDDYMQDLNVPRTTLYPGISYEMLIKSFITDKVKIDLVSEKDVSIPFYCEADVGGWAAEIFCHPQIYRGSWELI